MKADRPDEIAERLTGIFFSRGMINRIDRWVIMKEFTDALAAAEFRGAQAERDRCELLAQYAGALGLARKIRESKSNE